MGKEVHAIRTDNGTGICRVVNFPFSDLNPTFPAVHTIFSFSLRCIEYMICLYVKECMALFHRKISQIRNILNYFRCSVKRRDVFQEIGIELGQSVTLSTLYCETCCLSTFEMIRTGYSIRRVIIVSASRIEELSFCAVMEAEWKTAEKVMTFLEATASIEEMQSELHYVILSLGAMLFKKLWVKCKAKVDDVDLFLTEVAEKMLTKFKN